ncbi:MAG: HAD family hydrolase [Terriglobales bacterium]
MYKLAIFDFDGTLVDSAPGIIDVMRQVVEEYKMPHTVLDEWRNLVGVPLMRQCEIIFPDQSEEYWLEIATRYRVIYDKQAIEICPLFPGLIDMLERLKKEHIKITIASSKRRYLIQEVLDHHELTGYFDLIVGAQDVSNHKPHPESVLQTLEKLDTAADDAVVTGDSSYDLDMARNAGVDAIGVTTGVHTADILARSEPKHIVGGLREVLPIILNGRMSGSGH